jgi:chromosome segregation ATPase
MTSPATSPPHAGDRQFFIYLNSLETRENENQARLEAHRRLTADLSHQISRLHQQNKKLLSKFTLLQDQVINEEESVASSRDILVDLQTRLDDVERENEFVARKCDEMKDEMVERNDALKFAAFTKNTDLHTQVAATQAELASAKTRARDARSSYRRKKNQLEEEITKKTAELETVRSVASWHTERGILTARLKKLKSALFSEQRTIEMAKKRDQDLAGKLDKLTGNEEGDSQFVRQVLAAELGEFEASEDSNTPEEDLLTEQEFGRELQVELKIAKESIEAFEKYRKDTLEALNGELVQCQKKGYLLLLREELNALQRELASL